MRIAMDVSCLASNGRGFARYVQTLLQGMASLLPQDDALLLYSDAPVPEARLPSRVRPSLRLIPPRALHGLWRRRDLVRAARSDGADLLHFPDNAVADCAPLPAVVTLHDISPVLLPERRLASLPMRAYFRLAIAEIGRRASAVIAVSETAAKDLAGCWAPGRPPVRCVLSGFRPQPTAEAASPPLPAWAPCFLFVGALEARKNLPNLLEGFRRFKAVSGLPHRLVLMGEIPRGFGVRGEDPRRLAAPDVILAGRRSLEDASWPALYRQATALVLVSWYETFGYPYLEAMAYDCPVLGTTAGAGPETIGDAGLLADPADPGAIAAALGRLATEPALRETLIHKGRERVGHFTVEAMAEGTLAVYREALSCAG